MITRVSIGQVRFNLPGLTADARGVAVGKELLLRFATLERLVSFLRLLSGERTSEEVWGQMRVLHARPAGGHPRGVRAAGQPGGGGDRPDRRHRPAGRGRACSPAAAATSSPPGTPAAPLGYDTPVIAEDDGDFTLYTEEGRTTFRQEGDLSLERLLLRLELRRYPGGAAGPRARPAGRTAVRGRPPGPGAAADRPPVRRRGRRPGGDLRGRPAQPVRHRRPGSGCCACPSCRRGCTACAPAPRG